MKTSRLFFGGYINEVCMIFGLFVAGFSPVFASDESLHNSFDSQTTSESSSEHSLDAIPDAETYCMFDFENHRHQAADIPVMPNSSTKIYDKDDMILRASLVKSMSYMLISFASPEKTSDIWTREINGRNSKFMHLHVQGRIVPGAKRAEQKGILRIVPLDCANVDEIFPERVATVKNRFAQHGIDLEVEFYLYENLQDFKNNHF